MLHASRREKLDKSDLAALDDSRSVESKNDGQLEAISKVLPRNKYSPKVLNLDTKLYPLLSVTCGSHWN